MNCSGLIIRKRRLEKNRSRKDFAKEYVPLGTFQRQSREKRNRRKKYRKRFLPALECPPPWISKIASAFPFAAYRTLRSVC